jgi:predicted lipid carrier protein YhbT
MAVFLSDEWIAALDGVLRAEQGLTECAAVTVEQTVVGTPSGDVRYRVVIDGRGGRADRLGVSDGSAGPPADVRLTTDYRTAVAIARGAENAQIALAQGRLRLGGDVHALARFTAALAAMPGVTDVVHAETTFDEPA